MTRPARLPSEATATIEPKWIMPADGIWVPVEHEITRGPSGMSERRCTDLERFKADMEDENDTGTC